MSRARVNAGSLFDQLADDYEDMREEVGWRPWPHVEAALGGGGWLDGQRALDVGCGTGEVARALIARGAEVVGVDTSERMCALAAERTPGGVFLVGTLSEDPWSLPFADEAFDITLALGCVEYVEDIEGACRTLARVTRAGGLMLYAVELCGVGLPGGIAREVEMFDLWRRHRRTLEEIEAQAQALLESPQVEVVPAYVFEETGEQLMYGRVIGRRPARSA